LKITRRAGAVGLALGLGLGLVGAWPALASTGHDHGHRAFSNSHCDDHGTAWGLDVNGEDGPAWGLDNTRHGPAFGVHVDRRDRFSLPVVLDDSVLCHGGMGVSAFGIDDASITGDNPVADAYLGNSGWNSLAGWTNDRQGWLGGLLGDDPWVIGGQF
jgi:hypothetical protein